MSMYEESRKFDPMTEDERLQRAYDFLWHSVSSRKFTQFERWMIALLYWKMGDRLLEVVADRMHTIEIGTLHFAFHGGYAEWFKEQRMNRKAIEARAKDWVPAEDLE